MKLLFAERYAAVVLVMIFMTSCAHTGALITSPTVNLKSVELTKASLNQQTFQLGFDVDNPNPFPLPIQAVKYNVFLDNEKFAGGSTQGNFTIPARGQDDFVISVDLDFLNTAAHLSSLLRRGMPEKVNYELDGSLTVDIPFAPPLPFSSSGVIDVQGY